MAQQKENEVAVLTNVPTNFYSPSQQISTCSAQRLPDESITSHQKLNKEPLQNSHRLLRQEIINDSRLLNASSEKRESRIKESETQKEIEITQKLLNVAASSFHDNLESGDKKPSKTAIPPEKPKRALQHKKPIQIQGKFLHPFSKLHFIIFFSSLSIRANENYRGRYFEYLFLKKVFM